MFSGMTSDYRPSDLLMFTAEVFHRLYIRLNEDLWPWQLLALVLGLTIPVLLALPSRGGRKAAFVLLAMAWVFSGAVFLMTYYAPINWPARYAGIAFLVQGLLILALVCGRHLPARLPAGKGTGIGIITFWLLTLLALPGLSALQAGDWRAVAVVGMTPDVTALGWIVCSFLIARPKRWLLLLVPLLWCLFSALTLWQLGAMFMLAVPLAGLALALLALFIAAPADESIASERR